MDSPMTSGEMNLHTVKKAGREKSGLAGEFIADCVVRYREKNTASRVAAGSRR